MNNPIPLDLAGRVRAAYIDAPLDTTVDEDMQAALAAHLPEIAACHYREVDVEVIERELPLALRYFHPAPGDVAKHIAAALSDATNGGHWEDRAREQWEAAVGKGERWQIEATGFGDAYHYRQWVPANPDAALLTIVDADTLARLREVAEVTAR